MQQQTQLAKASVVHRREFCSQVKCHPEMNAIYTGRVFSCVRVQSSIEVYFSGRK